MRWRERAAWCLLIAVASAGTVIACRATADARSSGTLMCSANPCVVQASVNGADGLRVVGSAGPALDHPLIVQDWQGAPQFFVNVGQVSTGDLPSCVTGPQVNIVGCLSPGPWDGVAGQYRGSPFLQLLSQSLSARDIRFLHCVESSPVAACRVALPLPVRSERWGWMRR